MKASENYTSVLSMLFIFGGGTVGGHLCKRSKNTRNSNSDQGTSMDFSFSADQNVPYPIECSGAVRFIKGLQCACQTSARPEV